MSADRIPQRTALVTGANGFLGSEVARTLVSEGWHVLALHRPGADLSTLEGVDTTLIDADVLDAPRLSDVLPNRLDAIVHCASSTSLWRRMGAEQLRINVRGTRSLARIAQARGARMVHISCAAAYGHHSGVICPETPRTGRNSPITFVRSKAMAEVEIESGLRSGLDAIVLNPGFMMGARDRKGWSRLVRLVAQRRLPGVPPGGATFCSARTVATAAVRAIGHAARGTRYLIGGVNVSYGGLAREIGTQLGHRRFLRPVRPTVLNAYARLEEAMAPLLGREPDVTRESVTMLSGNTYCDGRAAQEALQLEAVPLETMVADCIDWMRANGQL